MCKTYAVEFDREEDGRWIAEVPEVPGVMVYGRTKEEARKKVFALLLRVMARKVEERKSTPTSLHFAVA